MVALPLLDLVTSSDKAPDRSAALAGQLVEAALADLQKIQQIDAYLMPDQSPFDRATAALIRGMYDDWARQAEGLLERVEKLQRQSIDVTGGSALRDAWGRTRAMLSVPLEHLEEAERDLAEGRTYSLEEVRRELRLGVH